MVSEVEKRAVPCDETRAVSQLAQKLLRGGAASL